MPAPFEDTALYGPYGNWASKVTSPLAAASKAAAFTWGFNSMTSQPTCFSAPSGGVMGSPGAHSSACAYMAPPVAPGAAPGYLYGREQYSPSSLSQFRLKNKATTGNGFGCSTHAQSSLPQCQYTGLPGSGNL